MTSEDIHRKVDLARENLARLQQIPQGTLEEFAADFRNLDSALHRLQTTIQALIDVASYAVASLGLAAPATSRDLLSCLEAAGELPAGSTDRFGPVFAFRNRVVHLYDRIDPAIVYRILREEQVDLVDLLMLLLAVLERVAEEEQDRRP